MKSRNSLKNPTKKGGVKMKKTLILTFFALLSIAIFYGIADALPCSNCHTMHNSQNGSAEAANGPFAQLLRADCVTCHTGSATSETTTYQAPRVLATADPAAQGGGETLAGGDFYWAKSDSDEYGHNPGTVIGADSIHGNDPPGWDDKATDDNKPGSYIWGSVANSETSWSSQLQCAGTYGCHGNHTDDDELLAIGGTHHNNGGAKNSTNTDGLADCTGNALGDCYRFLGGIVGFEDEDYQWTVTNVDHNEYSGAADTGDERDDDATPVYANADTISFLCAECHGEFHSRIYPTVNGSFGGPWVRHPTDIVLPSTGEYGSYNQAAASGANLYNVDVPVARGTMTTSASAVTEGDSGASGAIVMCLSCHRAHGSPQKDMLRFTYSNIDAGAGTNSEGCFVCHSEKDTQ
jgi:predicted CXXCH cytochrome family protein